MDFERTLVWRPRAPKLDNVALDYLAPFCFLLGLRDPTSNKHVLEDYCPAQNPLMEIPLETLVVVTTG